MKTSKQLHKYVWNSGYAGRVSSLLSLDRCHVLVDPIVNYSILSEFVALRWPLRTYSGPNSKIPDSAVGKRENFSPCYLKLVVYQ